MILKKKILIMDLREASNEEIAGLLNVLLKLESVLLPCGCKLDVRVKPTAIREEDEEQVLCDQL